MVRIAIIGCGHWGPNYIRNFKDIPDSDVTWCCDTDAGRLENIRNRFPEINTTTQYLDIMENNDIDAVIVATPASTHYEIVKTFLSADKHVLVEKPMTTNIEHAENLVDITKKSNKILMVGHVFLYNAGIRKMKQYITNGNFGQIYYMYSTRTNLGPVRHDVNVTLDLAPHDISVFGYLLDSQPVWVSATGTKALKNHNYDVSFISICYPENVIANIHVSWIDPNKVRELVIVGSQKRIVFNDLNNQEMIRIFEKGISYIEQPGNYGDFLRFSVRDGDIISPKIDISEPLKNQCQHFLDCIKNNSHPLTDAQNGRDIVKILSAIQKSLDKNGTTVEV